MRIIPAHPAIFHVQDAWLEGAMRAAPRYDHQFAVAMQRIQRCIHGLGKIHSSYGLTELEIYLGRATRSTVRHRWNCHFRERKHLYGAILFRCNAAVVRCLEDVAILIVKQLEKNDALCVGNANIWKGDQGLPPGEKEAIVYMTWKTLEKACHHRKATMSLLRKIAASVHQATKYKNQITRGQILRGLACVRRRATDRARLDWWNPAW